MPEIAKICAMDRRLLSGKRRYLAVHHFGMVFLCSNFEPESERLASPCRYFTFVAQIISLSLL